MRSQDGRLPADRLADIALLAVAAIWGATFPLVQAAVHHTPPLPFLILRFLIAAAALVPAVILRGGLTEALHPRGAAPGLCLAAGYWLQTEGLRIVAPSVSAFLTGTSVVLVPVLAWMGGQEKARARVWIAAVLALGGILAMQGRLPGRWSAGETLTALCAVAFALQILLIGRLTRGRCDPIKLGSGQIFYAAAFLIAAGAARGTALDLPAIPPISWFALFFTGLLATAGAFILQTWAQRRLPSSHAAVLFASEPLFAAIVSVGFCGERLVMRGVVGAGMILIAVLLTTISQPPGADAGTR